MASETPGAVANYRIKSVSFRVVRHASDPDPRILSVPRKVVKLVQELGLLCDDAKEHFWALLLDVRLRLVAVHHVGTGSLTSCWAEPREVLAPALRIAGIDAVILLHNHPSGDPSPSRSDVQLTRRLRCAGELLGVRVLDHIIVGDGSGAWVSMEDGRRGTLGLSKAERGHGSAGQGRRAPKEGTSAPWDHFTSRRATSPPAAREGRRARVLSHLGRVNGAFI